MKGYNATIFAYGATGSGKTHTVLGTENDPGIILRTVKGLLDCPDQFLDRGSQLAQAPVIQMSFLELYNNRAFDLLEPKGNEISIRDDHGLQTHCPDLARITISSNEQFSERFRLARNERITAPTRLNDQSSRSHAMLILYIQYSDGTSIFRCICANICPHSATLTHLFSPIPAAASSTSSTSPATRTTASPATAARGWWRAARSTRPSSASATCGRALPEPPRRPSSGPSPLVSARPQAASLPPAPPPPLPRHPLPACRGVVSPTPTPPYPPRLCAGDQRHQRGQPARAVPGQQAHPPPRRLPPEGWG